MTSKIGRDAAAPCTKPEVQRTLLRVFYSPPPGRSSDSVCVRKDYTESASHPTASRLVSLHCRLWCSWPLVLASLALPDQQLSRRDALRSFSCHARALAVMFRRLPSLLVVNQVTRSFLLRWYEWWMPMRGIDIRLFRPLRHDEKVDDGLFCFRSLNSSRESKLLLCFEEAPRQCRRDPLRIFLFASRRRWPALADASPSERKRRR